MWYLAGPMTGIDQNNYPAFAAAARDLRSMDVQVVSPHELVDPALNLSWQALLRCDLEVLTRDCTGIILLPGWSKSRGARLELATALALDMPVLFYSPDGKLVDIA